jgi:hypothetical protein
MVHHFKREGRMRRTGLVIPAPTADVERGADVPWIPCHTHRIERLLHYLAAAVDIREKRVRHCVGRMGFTHCQ